MKKIISIILTLVILFSLVACTRKPKEITLKAETASIDVGETYDLKYTISPAGASEDVVWSSSDENVATVSDGEVTAINKGECTITVTTINGLSAECQIVTSINYCKMLKNEIGTSSGITYASDGSYVLIDTNPYNEDDYLDFEAVDAIEKANEILGLPESVYQSMLTTTSLQGLRESTYGDVTVSWTYHPSNGLEVMYEFAR